MRDKKPYEKLRLARRVQGITQSVLAREVGCKQSAISMFEAGHSGVLSDQIVQQIAKHLGVNLALPVDPQHMASAPPHCFKFCPVDTCPSSVPYMVQNRPVFRPTLVLAPEKEPTICVWCGETLESCCPNTECAAALCEGAFCPSCRSPYVTVCVQVENIARWIEQRQHELQRLHVLTQPQAQSQGQIQVQQVF